MRRGVVFVVCSASAGCLLFTDLSGLSSGGGAADAADDAVGSPDTGADVGARDAPSGSEASAPSAYAAAVMSDSPLVWLRLDETSGVVAKDSSGNGHDAAVLGKVTWSAGGAIASGGTAVHFDGLTSGLDLGKTFDFAGTAPFTLEAWVREEVVDSTFRHLFTKDDESGAREEYGIFYQQGAMAFERYVVGTQAACGQMRPDLVGRWAHTVGTYDGAKLVIYIDGVAVDNAPDTRAQASKPVPFYAGMRSVSSGVVQGSLDEIAVYGTALSATRVKAHFDAASKP